ncbi:MAG: LamG domain-containing protein [Chthoniobacterales bacterium]|nr:LamG domain-containing protein [Chthoniobacterales bacterium]
MTTPHLDPAGHWPLETDHRNHSTHDLIGMAREITYEDIDGRRAAVFHGAKSSLEIADHPALRPGTGDFSVSLWLHTKDGAQGGDVVGDLISKFDGDARKGFNLVVSTQTGTTVTTQPNYRQIQFGIDEAYVEEAWQDCGTPGQAVKICALLAMNGHLFAGTFENGEGRTGHVWQYEGGKSWSDLGAPPAGCNSMGSLTCFDGDLFAASGRYNPRGSQLGMAQNIRSGGPVYRITSDGTWKDCGHPGLEGAAPDDPDTLTGESNQADDTNCLTVFRGNLYATSHHRRGLFRYEGGKNWKPVGPDLRIMSLTIHEGRLLALINGGGAYRYEDGTDWTWIGDPPLSTQTYCALTHQGRLLVGTWPECHIVRYEGGTEWKIRGMVGYEREVMAASLYNGKAYFGTLPMANIFRMDGDSFTYFGNIDNHPGHHLRRAWSMAVHQGALFAGSLPQGKVMRRCAGAVATHDHALPSGWRHLAAVRTGNEVAVYLDGKKVAGSPVPGTWNMNTAKPLTIGGAAIGHAFSGALRDVRFYQRALTPEDLQTLAI